MQSLHSVHFRHADRRDFLGFARSAAISGAVNGLPDNLRIVRVRCRFFAERAVPSRNADEVTGGHVTGNDTS